MSRSVFAEPGSSLQQNGGECPEGWVVMQGERPSINHVAQLDGAWLLSEAVVKSGLLALNNGEYEKATITITADYPQLEKDTWPTQDKESKAWVADPDNALTPWIDRAAAARGIERDEYLRRTLAKAQQFEMVSSYLTGTRQNYEDQIKAGFSPTLDYSIPPEISAEMQARSLQIMTTPTADLRGLF